MEKRQRFSAEFKREAIRMMQTSGKPVAIVARGIEVFYNRQRLHGSLGYQSPDTFERMRQL